ncbi:MAG: ribosome assembly cofactor RimP [Spirochaetaceae bacterium]|nr:ribosome assembly cofactor RimP [Spirochaetaceae bacterium]
MEYTPRKAGSREPADLLFEALEPLARGLGMSFIELSLFRRRGRGGKAGTVQVKITAYKPGIMGVNDCSALHRALLPRLELEFPGGDLYLEVSSPGIDRLIRDGNEFAHYLGRGVKCYCRDISDWIGGVLRSAGEEGIVLEIRGKETLVPYEIIAKAKLDEGFVGL